MKRRIEWVDLSKFVGIFAMVWGHSGVNENMDIIIHAFHMPLFFFLSGYLYKDGRIKKKAKTLLIPYFVFGIGLFLLWKAISKIIILPVYYGIPELIRGLFYDNAVLSPYAGIQWFLTCLFLTEVIFYIIKKCVKRERYIILALVLFSLIGFVYPMLTVKRLFWALDCAFTAIVFYGAGFIVSSHKISISEFLKKTWVKTVVVLVLAFMAIAATYLNGYVNMRTMQYGNYFLYYISAFSIIALIMLFTKSISQIGAIRSSIIYKGILYIGQNTLIVLVMNQFFNQLFRWFVKPYIHVYVTHPHITDFVFAIIMLILMIPVSYIIQRFFPFVLGKPIKKGKK